MLSKRSCATTIIVLFAAYFSPASALAQNQTGDPYAPFHDMQTLEADGETVRAIRVPVYITLRSWTEHDMGLRLRLAATAAASDLFDLLDQGLREVRVIGFVPGMEFIFPIRKSHMLRPFLDAGVGTNDQTNDLAFLGDIGLRTEFIFPRGENIFGLEPGFQLSFSTSGGKRHESVFSPFISLSARRLLGWRISGYETDAGIYFDGGYDFQSFELTSITASSDDVDLNLEIGLGFGFSKGRPRLFGVFGVPRLRIGYRFGDLSGFRIRIGGDWLTTVADRQRIEADN
jgi:hypothetical protein